MESCGLKSAMKEAQKESKMLIESFKQPKDFNIDALEGYEENWDYTTNHELDDEFGYDDRETIIIPDNPFFDGTDFAHPAWWRSHEQSFNMFCVILEDVLNGNTERHHGYSQRLQWIVDEIRKLKNPKEQDNSHYFPNWDKIYA